MSSQGQVVVPKCIQSGPCNADGCNEPCHYIHTVPFQFCVEHLEKMGQRKEVLLKERTLEWDYFPGT